MTVEHLIKKHEGIRLKPYQCSAGKWTIGWGHNLTDHGEPVPEIITQEQADELFQRDLNDAMAIAYSLVPNFGTLSSVRRAVLTDMAYQMGKNGLKTFRRFLQAIIAGNFVLATIEMLDSEWARKFSVRARDNALLMLSDRWLV